MGRPDAPPCVHILAAMYPRNGAAAPALHSRRVRSGAVRVVGRILPAATAVEPGIRSGRGRQGQHIGGLHGGGLKFRAAGGPATGGLGVTARP